jgi:hypothetical protein
MKNIMKNVLTKVGLIFLFTLASSCATTETGLEPAPGTLTSGRGHHQVTETLSGVELTANADAWKGMPEIVQEIIPVKVVVRNHHGKPITVRYRDFSLVSNEGGRYAANPPEEIHGTVTLPAENFYTGSSFYYLEDLGMIPYFGYYPETAAMQPYYYDPWWYSRYYGTMPVKLPTKDMVTEALPEMRVPDGGGDLWIHLLQPDQRRKAGQSQHGRGGDGRTPDRDHHHPVCGGSKGEAKSG